MSVVTTSQVLKGEVCVGAQSATEEEQLTSQQACFAKCAAQISGLGPDLGTSTLECVAASYDKESKKCTLQTRDECSDLVSDKSTVVAKVWCGRASRWIFSGNSKRQCAADGTWYFCGDSECSPELTYTRIRISHGRWIRVVYTYNMSVIKYTYMVHMQPI